MVDSKVLIFLAHLPKRRDYPLRSQSVQTTLQIQKLLRSNLMSCNSPSRLHLFLTGTFSLAPLFGNKVVPCGSPMWPKLFMTAFPSGTSLLGQHGVVLQHDAATSPAKHFQSGESCWSNLVSCSNSPLRLQLLSQQQSFEAATILISIFRHAPFLWNNIPLWLQLVRANLYRHRSSGSTWCYAAVRRGCNHR